MCSDRIRGYLSSERDSPGNRWSLFRSGYRPDHAVDGKPNLVQELLYTGRNNARIGMTYREFTVDSERPSFVQELQYDLAESQEVVFRAVRLRVLKADSGSITYRVLSGFDSAMSDAKAVALK